MERIVFDSVSKTFSLGGGRKLLRGHLQDLIGRGGGPSFYALRNVSFTLRDGESLAVIGSNGAGKSTLLNLATQVCDPNAGQVKVNGRVSAVLELGSGFHYDLTGAENLRLNASLSGLDRRKTAMLFDEIVEFSGVGEFIDQPLRTYSAGMTMRLAFSVAIHTDPDILIVDEVMGVGDQAFHAKCFDRILGFRKAGKTILCASHAADMLRLMCERAIWLDHGQVILHGKLEEVLAAYQGRTVGQV
ncbi:MAG: ABC transporter ATP-binding protein [Bryobacteraceae bacterium]|jgi:ABC-type polysaccharide/polyol phosphate transport system ATPase subunit